MCATGTASNLTTPKSTPATLEWTDEELDDYLHGRKELPNHTKHNKGITCVRCTLNTKLKHLGKKTGVYLTVERPKPVRIKAPKRQKKERIVISPKAPRQRKANPAYRQQQNPKSPKHDSANPVEAAHVDRLSGCRRVLDALRTVLDETGERFLSDDFEGHPARETHPEYYSEAKGGRPISLSMIADRLAQPQSYSKSKFEADMNVMFAHAVYRGVAIFDSFRLEGEFKNLMEAENARELHGNKRGAAVDVPVDAEDRVEEETWQKGLRTREKMEKQEKRVVKQWAEDRDQAMANRWMFKRNKTTEEKKQSVEFDRLVHHTFSAGEETFDSNTLDGVFVEKQRPYSEDEVMIPIVKDLGEDAIDFPLDDDITMSFQKAYSTGYLRWDSLDEELPPTSPTARKKVTSPRGRPTTKPKARGPRTPQSRSVSTVPGQSVSPTLYESDSPPPDSSSEGQDFIDSLDDSLVDSSASFLKYSPGKRQRNEYFNDNPELSGRRVRKAPAHHSAYLV